MLEPLDIKTQKFKKGLFGYNGAAVEEFRNKVYSEYEALFNENKELSEKLAKLTSAQEESRLKIFELENEVSRLENAEFGDSGAASKKAEDIIKNAEEQAAKIIANAKAQSGKIDGTAEKKESKFKPVSDTPKETKAAETVVEPQAEPVKESASSKFFKKAEDAPAPKASSDDDDDDEIFVGEIEDARKPERMMIGDGEEESVDDFEFL